MINQDISEQIKETVPAIEEVRVLLGLLNNQQALRWLIRDYSVRNTWGPHLTQDERDEIIAEHREEFEEIYSEATSGLGPVPPFRDSDVELQDIPDDGEINDYLEEFIDSDYFQDPFGHIPEDNWSVQLVPIRSLIAFQPHVSIQAHREVPTSADGLLDVIQYCLPHSIKNYLIVESRGNPGTTVETRVVSRNPNVNLIGPSIEQIEDRPEGNVSVTFNIKTRPNFVQVAHYGDRYILKNGYHRSYQLMAAGEEYIPAIVRDVVNYEDTGAADPGWFGKENIMGVRPPTVSDFLTDVAVNLESKGQNKMIRVVGEKMDIER